MTEKKWSKAEIHDVLARMHKDIIELTRTWSCEHGVELGDKIRVLSWRLVKQNDLLLRLKGHDCFLAVHQARADIDAVIRVFFGARNFGVITQEVYNIFRDRCELCQRLLSNFEHSIPATDASGFSYWQDNFSVDHHPMSQNVKDKNLMTA